MIFSAIDISFNDDFGHMTPVYIVTVSHLRRNIDIQIQLAKLGSVLPWKVILRDSWLD